MKKILLVSLIGIAIGSTAVYAQQKDKGARVTRADAKVKAEIRAQRTSDKMAKELDLTKDQQDKVYQIAYKNFSANESSEASRKKMNDDINNVLTKEQNIKRANLETNKVDRMKAENGKARTPSKAAAKKVAL